MRPTGVTIIDRAIGGFPAKLPLAVVAANATARSALLLAIAHHALARGESVRFLTRQPSASLLRQAVSLGFDLEPPLADGRLGLFEMHEAAPALLRQHGSGMLTDALVADLDGPALVIVDPFSALLSKIDAAARLHEITRTFTHALAGNAVVLGVEAESRVMQQGLAAAIEELCGASFAVPETSDRTDIDLAVAAPVADAAVRSKLLVVEDDRLQREMLRDWLSPHYDVTCAGDGFEAFSALLADPPDLVVLDLILPRVSGYELLQSMRRARFEMPVLVSSSRVATAGERLGPLVLGATEFLAKPVARVELLHKVETLLRLPRGGGPARFADSQPESEALFGSFSNSRLLESAEFAERVGRACEFGRKHGLTSCLLGLAADAADALDHWIEVANRQLRYEDAILRADKHVAVMLLVATDPLYASRVLERLRVAAGEALPKLQTASWLARPEHAEPGAIEALLGPLQHPNEAAT